VKSARSILQCAARAVLTAVLFGGSVLAVLLTGYLLGWSTGGAAPHPSSTSPKWISPFTGSEAGDQNPVDGTRAPAQQISSRLSRLAAWLVPSRHRRTSETRVLAEIGHMTSTETQEALRLLEGAPDSSAVSELRTLLLLRCASMDPLTAFSYWRTNADRISWQQNAASELFIRWATQDPRAALQHWRESASKLTDPDASAGYALRQIFTQLARRDFQKAMTEAAGFAGEDRLEAFKGLASVPVNDSNRMELLELLFTLPSGSERTTALTAAVAGWFSSGQPAAALAWLDSQALEPAETSAIRDEVARRWFMKDRQAAADWLLGRANTPAERAHALEHVTFQWTQYDLPACGEWLRSHGGDTSASGAMQIYAERLAVQFPEDAVTWARSIPDSSRREKALAKVTQRIRQLHPDRATYILQSPR
jgi:hypothetical protein